LPFSIVHSFVVLFEIIAIYTTFPHNKNNELQKHQAPSPVGEGWGDDCMDAGGRAMQERLPRRVKSSIYIPLIPAFSLWRRSSRTCVDTYALKQGVF